MKRAPGVLRAVSILPTPCFLWPPHRPAQATAAGTPAAGHDRRDVAQTNAVAGLVDAAAWRAELEQRAAEARRAGFDAGHQEGLHAGRQEAHAEALAVAGKAQVALDALVAQTRSRLEHLLQAAAVQSHRFVADAEDDIVALAHEALCRILGRLAPDASVVRAMAQQLIASSSAAGRPAVHVHPEDLDALVQTSEDGVLQDNWDWVPDASVQLGGVVLRRGCGSLDGRLETQMEALHIVLLRTRNERKAQSGRATGVVQGSMQEQEGGR